MPNVVKCWPVTTGLGNSSGSRPSSYRATWIVELDGQCDFECALAEGRAATGSFDAGGTIHPFQRIPRKGAYYRWVNSDGSRSFNRSALALDFQSSADILSDGTTHAIDVTWRPPTPGGDEEPNRVNKAPWKRRPYYWIEYYTVSEEVFDARNVEEFGPDDSGKPNLLRRANTPGPLTTAAGEETEIATDERMHMVFCAQKNIRSAQVGAAINSIYEGRLNNNIWAIPPELWDRGTFADKILLRDGGKVGVRKLQARFLRTEVSQYPEYWDGQPYFQMITRVRVSPRPFYKTIANRGVLIYQPGSPGRIVVNRDNDNVVQKTNLDRFGQPIERNVPFTIDYQIAGDTRFGKNLGFT